METTSSRPRRSSPLNLPSALALFKPSRDIVLKNIWIFGPLYAVPIVFWIHSWIWSPVNTKWWTNGAGLDANWTSIPGPSHLLDATVGFSIIWFVIVAVIGTIAQIMALAAQLAGAQGEPTAFDTLWATVKELGWRIVGLYLVVTLVVLVGLILLIIPGLIMLRRYLLAPYVMIDKKYGIRKSMEYSAALSKPYSHSVWGIIGMMFLISLIGIIPFIGSLVAFVLGMFYSVAPALRYEELKRLSHS